MAYYFGYTLPSYNLVNARVGVTHGSWSADLFVDNLTNKVALMTANNTSFQFNIPELVRYSTNQPRTIGTLAPNSRGGNDATLADRRTRADDQG